MALIHIIGFTVVAIMEVVVLLIVLFFSDKGVAFRMISVLPLLPMLVLEFFHYFFPDPTNLIDIFTHIVSGLVVFLAMCNFKVLSKINRQWIAVLITILVIVVVEVSINAPSLDSLEDFYFTIVGAGIGLPIYYLFNWKTEVNGECPDYCKCD
jgi:hypothetical protein